MLENCKKANTKLSFLHRYSSILDFDTRRLLCSSLVSSGLNYCVSAWYPGLGEGLKGRLDIIQRKMVRFVNAWRPRDHVGEREINSVGWLFFPKRVSFFKLCHLFKVRLGQAPNYVAVDFCPTSNIHSHNTRGSRLNYHVDSAKFPPTTFHYTTVREWNSLPEYLKEISSLPLFKRKLKRHLSL